MDDRDALPRALVARGGANRGRDPIRWSEPAAAPSRAVLTSLAEVATAFAALTGLNQLSTSQIRDLIGKIQTGSPDVFSPTAAVSAADYQAVWGLVDSPSRRSPNWRWNPRFSLPGERPP